MRRVVTALDGSREREVVRLRPSGIRGAPIRVHTVPTVADDAQYEYTSVQVFRGSEAATIAKWRTDGWELDSRDQGLLRTDLNFRRVKPATLGARARAVFSRLEPRAQRGVVAAAGGLAVLMIAGGVVAGMQGGGSSPTPAASTTEVGATAALGERKSAPAPRTPGGTTPADPSVASPASQSPEPLVPEAPKTQAPAPVPPRTQAPAPIAPKTQAPAPVTPKPEAPAPVPAPAPSTYYQNCDAVRAAGAAPIRIGEPGYSRKLDREGDGIGCE